MPELPPIEPPAPIPVVEASVFLRRMKMATYGIVLFVLTVYLLEKFRDILQPFFVAMFLSFMMQPVHRWLVRRGIPSLLAYGVIVALVMLVVFALGALLYSNITSVDLRKYEDRLDKTVRTTIKSLPFQVKEPEPGFLRQLVSTENVLRAARAALGGFGDFTSWAVLTFVYILFLIAERVSFPRRLELAFGESHGLHILAVVDSINQAIGQYVAVKTLVSALAGLLSYAVLAAFDVEFAATWGILIFLLNYIPYIGSLIAVALPILLSFLQFDEPWKGVVIAVLLVGIQQAIGVWIEPRMAGQRLDVSPLLILLSLAFWGFVWGIIGAILAVPLLVIVRIILDNIAETKPIATLISNR